jgi:hypothetical protein
LGIASFAAEPLILTGKGSRAASIEACCFELSDGAAGLRALRLSVGAIMLALSCS